MTAPTLHVMQFSGPTKHFLKVLSAIESPPLIRGVLHAAFNRDAQQCHIEFSPPTCDHADEETGVVTLGMLYYMLYTSGTLMFDTLHTSVVSGVLPPGVTPAMLQRRVFTAMREVALLSHDAFLGELDRRLADLPPEKKV